MDSSKNSGPDEIFKLETMIEHPMYEGFALKTAPSLIGREDLDDDITPGYDASETKRLWTVPLLSDVWQAPKVVGRVVSFNDYPAIGGYLPAFSKGACEKLKEFLEPNGELLPLDSDIGQFYFYNITKIVDALDIEKSLCDFWCDPPTTAVDIDYFAFHKEKLEGLSLFRIFEMPLDIMVTDQFVKKVNESGLKGFRFKKIWPLPQGTNWRMYYKEQYRSANTENPRKNTLVICLGTAGKKLSDKEIKQINKIEDDLDALLLVPDIDAPYFGRYEGNDIFDNEYRMFISCPDADALETKLLDWLIELNWSGTLSAAKRYGEMHDDQAEEVRMKI